MRYFITLLLLQACISGAGCRSFLPADKEFSKFQTIALFVGKLLGNIYRLVNKEGMFLDRNNIDIVSGSWQSLRTTQHQDDSQSILNAEKVKYKCL